MSMSMIWDEQKGYCVQASYRDFEFFKFMNA